MRALLHFGLFALTFAVVAQASADDGNRRGERYRTIVTVPQASHHGARPVRTPSVAGPPRYEYQRPRNQRVAAIAEVRHEIHDAERDHARIVRIVDRWHWATRHHDPRAQRNAERSVDLWIAGEIEESSVKPDHGRYVQRLHALRRELRATQGRHTYGRRGQDFAPRRARVLTDLLELSEHQVRRVRARARGRMHLAFAYR